MEHSNQYNLRKTVIGLSIWAKHGTKRESTELQSCLQWDPFNIVCGEGSKQLLESDGKEDFVDRATRQKELRPLVKGNSQLSESLQIGHQGNKYFKIALLAPSKLLPLFLLEKINWKPEGKEPQ